MTDREARGFVNDLREILEGHKFHFSKEFTEATQKAQEALEKRIPEEPKTEWNSDNTYSWEVCPECGSLIIEAEKFCPNCGQAIDWEAWEKRDKWEMRPKNSPKI